MANSWKIRTWSTIRALCCVTACREFFLRSSCDADGRYLSWHNAGELLRALSRYRRSLGPETSSKNAERPVSGSSWSWWRRKGQTAEAPEATRPAGPETTTPPAPTKSEPSESTAPQFAKTLRLSSDQLVCATQDFTLTTETAQLATGPEHGAVLRHVFIFRPRHVHCSHLPVAGYGSDCHLRH